MRPCIGLTGGIASGKSTVATEFARLGAHIIDTDLLARELVEPGCPALKAIVNTFGGDILLESGQLDRAALREQIFHDPAARHRLEAILHPPIRALARARAEAAQDTPYVLLMIPLLAETGGWDWLDRVLLVDCPPDIQRSRLLQRPGITPELADAILASQASREQRLALADDILRNDRERDALQPAIEALDRGYRDLQRTANNVK